MKRLFVAIGILFSQPMFCSAVTGSDTTTVAVIKNGENFSFERVIQTPSQTKDVLYKKAKAWVLSTMKTADQNISYDEENFKIVNSGAKSIDPKKNSAAFLISEGYFNFKILFEFKDGKYRVKIDNFEIFTRANTGFQVKDKTRTYAELSDNKEGKYIREQIDEKLTSLIRSLNGSLVSSEQKNSDW
ncbi:MAG: DUF4468 domain-containing protein [Chitinophagaceae bacterium]|jgi:hypothetical protein